ncbi:MAG: AAA family ATPase, partial [Candidatus Dormiibacterota bacterium]
MRIVRISLLAFGAFRDFHLDLAPGLTVVSGPNEAGKSTLHAATLAAIGGVRRGRGRGPELTDLRERYRPWDGDRWSVRAIVELADGVQVELTRNLNDTSRWQVTELHTGRDRSSEILFDGAPDGWRWLGLDRTTYPRTAGVRQADVLAITEAPKALAEHLQRAIAAPGADATAARALLRIDEFAREHVGSLAANSQKPLRRAMLAEQVTQARLQDARRTHADYLGLGAELDALERTATGRATALRTAEAALAQRRAEQERDQLDRLGALAALHPLAPPDPGDEEPIARGAASAVDGWRHRPRGPDLTGPPASELRSRLEALPACPVGETAPAPRVRQAAEEYRAAVRGREVHERRRPAPPPSPASGQPPDVLNLLAHELDAGPPAASGGWVGRAAPVLALAAVIAILGFAVIAVTRNPIW